MLSVEREDPITMEMPVDPQDTPAEPSLPYKEAKYLAASRRREGSNSYVVFEVAPGAWCVKVGASSLDAR